MIHACTVEYPYAGGSAIRGKMPKDVASRVHVGQFEIDPTIFFDLFEPAEKIVQMLRPFLFYRRTVVGYIFCNE
jgi:hypothetical protein